MSIRGLLIGVVLLGILAGGVYWSDRQKKAEDAKTAEGGATKLATIKEAEIQKIEIHKRDGAPTALERDKSNQWAMVAPQPLRVDQDAATGVASTYSGLNYDRVIEDKAADLSAFGLQTPAVEVTVTSKSGKASKLLLGDDTPTGSSAYAKLSDDPRVFTVPTSTKSSLDKTFRDLREKRLLIFDAEKLTTVALTAKGAPLEFGRNGAKEWQIVKPKPMRADTGQVEELVRKLGETKMDTAVPEEEVAKAPAAFASGTRVAVASITDSSGTQTLEVRKKGDDYYAKSSATEGIYRVAADSAEALNKPLESFRTNKLFEFGFEDPTRVEIRDGDKSYSFLKGGDKWTANGKAADPVGVQSLIDKLRELRSIKFVETGFNTPDLEMTVTSSNGKRVEKVSMAKSNVAKRNGDPTLYELDGKAVEEIRKAAADVKEPPPPPKK